MNIESLPNERWTEYNGYLVSDCGRIYSNKSKFKYSKQTGKLLKPHKAGTTGYLKQCLNGQSYSIHRLVALIYIPNPLNLPEVHHIDHNKENNHYTNLKWVTHAVNIQLSYSEGNRKVPTGADHWNYGKKVSKQTKEKQSAAKTGDKHPKFKGHYIYEDQQFASCQQLADHLGTYSQKIHRMYKAGLIKREQPANLQ